MLIDSIKMNAFSEIGNSNIYYKELWYNNKIIQNVEDLMTINTNDIDSLEMKELLITQQRTKNYKAPGYDK